MISSSQESKLRQLQSVFQEENAKLNLSALRDEKSIWVGNILDSLPFLELDTLSTIHYPLSILDIGTGGGFPLLPLAICKPEWQFTGLDSTQKKLDAITRMAHALDLTNVHTLFGRTEELGHDKAHREQYDIVTARAVAPLNTLLEFSSPFVKKGGYIVAWKSMKVETELKESLLARAELSCHLETTHEYELPEDFGKRQLLVFKKTDTLNAKYPRETGMPKKKPLV